MSGIHQDMQKSGVTLSLLWQEYYSQCRTCGKLPYQFTQFNKYYADYVYKTKATMHMDHKPGDTMQVDWAGQTGGIINTDTGGIIPVYLFVAEIPYSGYAYTEGFRDMKQEAWINAHARAYQYFGGITRLLVPDNLKTGIVKNTKDETAINKTYQKMATYYGTAILPARPKSPKDKAAVEGAVGNVSTWILAALRNRQFFSLEEINEAIWDKLYYFNHRPFPKKEGSRAPSGEGALVYLRDEMFVLIILGTHYPWIISPILHIAFCFADSTECLLQLGNDHLAFFRLDEVY